MGYAMFQPDLKFEQELWISGAQYIAGIDEAGRGALAGPVTAAALILPQDMSLVEKLHGVRDSKQMTAKQRQYWADILLEVALAWGVGFASCEDIDHLGIVPATHLAAQRALEQVTIPPDHLLLDWLHLQDVALPQTSLVKGDCRSLSIAGASVLAKTARDAWMRQVDDLYPAYGFSRHKGYGTAAHIQTLMQIGPCPIHRFSFAPLAEKRNR